MMNHITSIRIPLFEVDLGQAVYHGNYYHLFELARESFFRHIGFPYKKLMDLEFHLTVVEAACKYRRPLHYDEQIEIHTRVSWIRNRSLGIEQKIYKQDNILCTELSLNLVSVKFTGKAATLPPEFVKCLETYSDAK